MDENLAPGGAFVPAFVSEALAEWFRPIEKTMLGATSIEDMHRLQAERETVAGPPPKATLAQVADHIEHVVKVAGIDHIGIGCDFAGSGGRWVSRT